MPEIKTAIIDQNSTCIVVGCLESDGDATEILTNISNLKVWGGGDPNTINSFSLRFYDIEDQHENMEISSNIPFELPLLNGRNYNKLKIAALTAPIYYQFIKI